MVWLVTFIDSADEAPRVVAVDSATINYFKFKEHYWNGLKLSLHLIYSTEQGTCRSGFPESAPGASNSIPKLILQKYSSARMWDSAQAQRMGVHLSLKKDLLLPSQCIYTLGRMGWMPMEMQENKFYSVNCLQVSVSHRLWSDCRTTRWCLGLKSTKEIDLLSVSMSISLWHSRRRV